MGNLVGIDEVGQRGPFLFCTIQWFHEFGSLKTVIESGSTHQMVIANYKIHFFSCHLLFDNQVKLVYSDSQTLSPMEAISIYIINDFHYFNHISSLLILLIYMEKRFTSHFRGQMFLIFIPGVIPEFRRHIFLQGIGHVGNTSPEEVAIADTILQ